MASSWQTTPVREITTRITKGTTPTTGGGAFAQKGIAFIKVESITEAGNILPEKLAFIDEATHQVLSRSIIQADDVLFTIAGTIGRTALIRAEHLPANTNQAVAIVRPDKEKVLPRFLYYALSDKEKVQQANSRTVQSVQANFSLGELGSLEVDLPSMAEQRAIASALGALDDKIELNRRMNATLEAVAQAVFKEWFVDGAKEKLPDGWQRMRLSELVDTQYGYTASASAEQVGPKFLRVTDINKQNWIEWSEVPQCEVSGKDAEAYKLKVGDILVARMADPGKSAIIEEEVDAVFASYLVRLKSANLAESYFLYHYLKSPEYMEYCEGAKTGSVQLNMNAKVIVAVELTVPPQALMDRFLDVVLPLRKRIVANVNESHTLAALRDTLLPKLMRGEVRIRTQVLSNGTH